MSGTMTGMADVSRSPFDLRSWQGLTAVLKAARESNLSPDAYAEFRNLVLEYAQKGGDAAIKNKIDNIIATFSAIEEINTVSEVPPVATSVQEVKSERPVPIPGRRLTPTFSAHTRIVPKVAPHSATPANTEPAVISIGRDAMPPADIPTMPPPLPAEEVKTPASVPQPVMSLDEYRARIMEIKRKVNALVGNPVMLMDKGNNIGRTYMGALLGAMKASSPGSTLNVDEAMQKLEAAFTEILAIAENEVKESLSSAPAPVEAVAVPEPIPVISEPEHTESEPVLNNVDAVVSEIEEKAEIKPPVVETSKHDAFTPVPVIDEIIVTNEEVLPDQDSARVENVEVPSVVMIPDVPETSSSHITSKQKVTPDRWDKDDQHETKVAIREAVDNIKQSKIPTRAVERGRRSYLPSLVDIEESLPDTLQSGEETPLHVHTTHDELSPEALLHRPESSMTGVTLGTPQTELMTSEISTALAQLLHEWNIFASSGLFGMGPGGIDHPVYQQLAHLPMGKVISGRWDNANPKIAHAIKDYVNAWRHEQGIAYSPTETFEHYLRRVAQRILKRQSNSEDAS